MAAWAKPPYRGGSRMLICDACVWGAEVDPLIF